MHILSDLVPMKQFLIRSNSSQDWRMRCGGWLLSRWLMAKWSLLTLWWEEEMNSGYIIKYIFKKILLPKTRLTDKSSQIFSFLRCCCQYLRYCLLQDYLIEKKIKFHLNFTLLWFRSSYNMSLFWHWVKNKMERTKSKYICIWHCRCYISWVYEYWL